MNSVKVTLLLLTMPDLIERKPENVIGKFYVDTTCIDCDLCRATAPHFFARDAETGQSFVYLQPKTEADIALAHEALEGCPSNSIGDDA
jgi:ferredoxin